MNVAIVFGLMFCLLALDLSTGQFRNPQASSKRELSINMLSQILTSSVRALLLVALAWPIARFLSQRKGVLAHVSVWLMFFVILMIDDYLNYWLHRMAHQWPLLWRLHKPHHTPTYLNVLMAGRENTFYYFLVPALWMAPILIYLGAGTASALVFGFKGVVTPLQHTGYRWDLWLRRYRAGRLLDIVEKVVVLQDFHHAHHGIGRYGNASSNYGNILCIWDVLHGTTVQRQPQRQDAWPGRVAGRRMVNSKRPGKTGSFSTPR
ncbi:sterol desaturase family protein [Paraburkholderia sp. CNPSo 3274]|uniref:sterol desaturase family protein n=1 Tax=Paraburkholderia sp. CNPSo 3274 TaxID=2940932 RepID=UPI0020B8A123|nr:sterol desaturase family protein [Paraburkholderia sp. CNPSo 3274]MCP3708851.1 sterol desaturase family protein [Paraburkholderia sp. CNPSo 3274]